MSYSTYTSPIDRMGAIARVGGEVQRQQIVNQEQPLRQGLLRQQGQINDQVIQQNMDTASDRVANRKAAQQQYENIEELKTNALRASTLLSIKDPQQKSQYLLSIADEYAGEGNMKAAKLFSEAALNDPNMTDASAKQFVLEAAANGINLPQQGQEQSPSFQKTTGVDAQGNPVLASFNPQTGQYINPQTQQPYAENEFFAEQKRQGPLVSNIGAIPKGMIVKTDAQGNQFLEEIPGGPAEQERLKLEAKEIKEQGKARRAANAKIFEGKRNLGQMRKLQEQADWSTTGPMAVALGWIPFTGAGEAQQNLDSLNAKIGFDTLQNMRDNSPTGGALGQVSERELDFLQKAIASLSLSQGEEQFQENLKEVMARYERALALLESEYDPSSEWSGKTDAEITEAINKKYPIFGAAPESAPSISSERAKELEAKYGL